MYYYFAYGKLMLASNINNLAPSAVRHKLGKLSNFRLDFAGYSEACRGALITIVPEDDAEVWGIIWKLHDLEMDEIDKAETSDGIYKAMEQCVELTNGTTLTCRIHLHTQLPHVDDDVKMRWKTLPSLTYMDAIRAGAKESNLPQDYIDALFLLSDNGRTTSLDGIIADPAYKDTVEDVDLVG